ncbi:hypothetical protein LX36DRAFT_609414 [Colletotrichum falcatum]|nr:hypothetical protein LX36DRAFT_609414 [Colletotrichum falcatum]
MSHPSPPLELFPPPPGFRSPITTVHRQGTYDFYGPVSPRLAGSAAAFVLEHCVAAAAAAAADDDDDDGLARALSSFLDDAAAHARKQHAGPAAGQRGTHSAWLCVRATPPTDAWVTPRWHRDGRMFDCTCGAPPSSCCSPRPHAKYAVTLLGPPTRMLRPSEAVDAAVREAETEARRRGGAGSDKDDDDNDGGGSDYYCAAEEEERAALAAALEGMPLVELRAGQVVRFAWGGADAPVHSEPDSSAEARVFASVLFGSEAELRDMCGLRGEVYGEEKTWVPPL